MSKIEKSLNLVIDSRERQPWTFESLPVTYTVQKIDAGDYTLADAPKIISIERKKTCRELLGNLVKNWDRFERELERLTEYKSKVIIVSQPNCFHKLYEQRYTPVHPNLIESRLNYIFIEYGIPTFFYKTNEQAEQAAFKLLEMAQRCS